MSEILLTKQPAPTNPSTNRVAIYVNSAGVPMARDENGNETPLGSTAETLATISVAGGTDVVLTTAQQSFGIFEFTGALTANINVVFGTTTKAFHVHNETSGAFTLTVKTAAQVGGVVVPQGYVMSLYSNGSIVEDGGSAKENIGVAAALDATHVAAANPHPQYLQSGAVAASDVTVLNAQNSDYTTVKNVLDLELSTGVVGTGNLVTSNGDGTANVAAANVMLRATNSDTAQLVLYKAAAANLALTNLQNNFIYAQYNAGAPNYVATTTERTDTNTNILIARVYRNGTTLHINNYAIVRANDNLRRTALRFVQTQPTAWASGAMLSEAGTRNIGITAGVLWQCTNQITTAAFDSSVASTFTYAYRDGIGGWTEQAAQTQINNTQYDNGTGALATLTAGRYAVAWVYMEVDNDVVVLFGQGDYTLAQANAATAPAALPPRVVAQGFLVGKIILQKSAAAFTSVESAFVSSLSTTAVNDHAQLANLQGGAAAEYYHMTAAQNSSAPASFGVLAAGADMTNVPYPASLVVGAPAGANLQHVFDHAWSAGATEGFALTNNGDGSIGTASGVIALRVSASELANIALCAVAADTSVLLVDNSINYVYVDYNAGAPIVTSGTALTDFNCMDKCILYTVVREGTTLYWVDARTQNVDANRKHRRMLLECEGFRHVVGGCSLASSGTRNFSITAGAFYYGLAKVSHTAFDTSVTDTFVYYYRNGVGGWTKQTAQTQINNTQYDNDTGTLATLSNNKFGVHWVYLILDNPTVIAVQFGQGDYADLASAQAATVPPSPPAMSGIGAMIGRIIVQKTAATFSSVEGAFEHGFTPSTAATHNDLSGLQGGALNEYYHLTAAQATDLTDAGDSSLHFHATDRNLANASGTLAVSNGGTGQTSVQAAINSLTSVSTATNEHVLTKDTTTGNAVFKAAASGVTLGVAAGNAVQVDQSVTAWTRAATTTLGTSLNGTLSDTSTTVTAFNGVAGVTYHVRALGAGSITHHATDLIITQGLASITTAAGDTFDVEMITGTTCRIKNYVHASKVITPYSCVRLNTANGYGSTNTKIRRFTNVVTNTGADITYADSAANGASFTINASGVYAISYTDQFNGGFALGASLNSAQLTTVLSSITASTRIVGLLTPAANYASEGGVSIPLVAGDVVRPHTDGAPSGSSTWAESFTITRVA